MKAKRLLALLSAIALVCVGLSSCNKDGKDDKGSNITGKFVISDASSPYAAIELTGNGEYIVTKNAPLTKADDVDMEDVWVYGKYTFSAGQFFLQGFGNLVIQDLGNGKVSIYIDATDGYDPITVEANHTSTVQEAKINNLLCRHWDYAATNFSLTVNGTEYVNFEVEGDNLSKWFQENEADAEGIDEAFDGLIITENGTYAVVYDNRKINVGSWNWQNSADGSMVCDWSNSYSSWFKETRFSGSMTVDVIEGNDRKDDVCVITKSFDMNISKLFSQKSCTVKLIYTLKDPRN